MSVAAAIIIRQRRLVQQFLTAGATSPETARTLDDLGARDDHILHRLKQRAVVREAKPGRFYVDEPSWTALRALRRRLAAIMLGLLAVGIGLAVAFGMFR